MKIFITGATGFIGSHLAQRLAAEGHQLRCLARSTSRTENLRALGAEIITADLTDRETLCDAMRGCDWVFHLANLYAMWHPRPEEFWQTNVEGTRCVMEAALEAGVAKVVYVSTVAVLGKPAGRPFDEDSPAGPRQFSTYGRSKAEGDQVVWELYRTRGLPVVTLYPGIVLGPGDDKPSGIYIQDLIRGRVPTPIFRRSVETYTSVEDVVEAAIEAAKQPDTVGKRYLIGGERLNGMDYAREICDVAGVRVPWMRLPDFVVIAAAYWFTLCSNLTQTPPPWGLSVDAAWTLYNGFDFDGSRAARELGFSYTPVREALSEAVAWYRKRWEEEEDSPRRHGVHGEESLEKERRTS
ncbi:nucleoside-diphosphate-sugar epimerase [Longilinea arvoryzae]|uniref:Nucleoside-diphosphate-sugar epimerase n=1 Tax=Longilinea arvoryzae TaxID=360412 RepID=A0A0S7BD42_9CHLR|nr:NAD-dependent epimerase/dehydratase family protein [Longilinea arvoryzae]GAP12355.1 nucleoside-diphosphate-sugar epimerase [Longilinea arvoryzae]